MAYYAYLKYFIFTYLKTNTEQYLYYFMESRQINEILITVHNGLAYLFLFFIVLLLPFSPLCCLIPFFLQPCLNTTTQPIITSIFYIVYITPQQNKSKRFIFFFITQNKLTSFIYSLLYLKGVFIILLFFLFLLLLLSFVLLFLFFSLLPVSL